MIIFPVGLGSMLIGAALAFAACLWGMPWPWLRAIAMVALPMCAVLNLVVPLCRGCFPIEAVMALGACMWACHSLGSMPTSATLTLAACP